MYKILTLNAISSKGLDRLPHDTYEISSEIQNPDGVLVRSHKMHDMELPDSLEAIGRAGAGVNNIPVDKMTDRGVCVFNAPGANANGVKELVLAGMLMASRNVVQGWNYVQGLDGDDAELHKAVEAGKKKYKGFELPGRTLGIVGLGAIGVRVANAAVALGMNVIGFDPGMTVARAWELDASVKQAAGIDDLLAKADYVTFHVPLVEGTRHLINSERLSFMKNNVVVLNFARDGIVDEEAMEEALDSGKAYAYVTDFPSNRLKGHERVVALPHLGASTEEAEDNCAVMVAEQLKDYLENGNIRNSVNFPEVALPRKGAARLAVVNQNRPDMVGQISHIIGDSHTNIVHMVNESRGEIACTLLDLDDAVSDDIVDAIKAIDGVLRVRVL